MSRPTDVVVVILAHATSTERADHDRDGPRDRDQPTRPATHDHRTKRPRQGGVRWSRLRAPRGSFAFPKQLRRGVEFRGGWAFHWTRMLGDGEVILGEWEGAREWLGFQGNLIIHVDLPDLRG